MSVPQFGTQTMVFTMSSRGNFNNFGCQNLRIRLLGGIFNRYQMLFGDFFSGFLYTGWSLQLVELSFHLQQKKTQSSSVSVVIKKIFLKL